MRKPGPIEEFAIRNAAPSTALAAPGEILFVAGPVDLLNGFNLNILLF